MSAKITTLITRPYKLSKTNPAVNKNWWQNAEPPRAFLALGSPKNADSMLPIKYRGEDAYVKIPNNAQGQKFWDLFFEYSRTLKLSLEETATKAVNDFFGEFKPHETVQSTPKEFLDAIRKKYYI